MSTRSHADGVATELFDTHAAGLYRLALVMLRNPDHAQDAVQDTFLKLVAHLAAGRELPNARGWLYTVAAHTCRDRQRGGWRWLPWVAELDRREAPPADTSGSRDLLLEALRGLTSRDRLLIALRAQGLSYQDMARASGVRPSSVGRLLARALDRLAARLDAPMEVR